MKRLAGGLLGGFVWLVMLVGASSSGEQVLTAFYLSATGVVVGIVNFWLIRAREGYPWRWFHTVATSMAGGTVVPVVAVAVLNPGDGGALGFALGFGVAVGCILGLGAALLVYASGLSTSAKSTPTETNGE